MAKTDAKKSRFNGRPTLASYCLFSFFSNTNFTEKNWSLQRDSNRQSRRLARWPLDQHHGPFMIKSLSVKPERQDFLWTKFVEEVEFLHLHLPLQKTRTHCPRPWPRQQCPRNGSSLEFLIARPTFWPASTHRPERPWWCNDGTRCSLRSRTRKRRILLIPTTEN